MSLIQIFIASITNPKKIAAFRLLPIGKVLQYVFLFVTILSVLSFINFTTGFRENSSSIEGLLDHVEDIEWIIYPFAFIIQFIMTTLLLFIRISLVAFGGMFILKLLNRRGDYRHVWRSTAFAYTTPTIISLVFLYTGLTDGWITIIATLICIFYLGLALKYYPQK
ncbi:DUF1189 family protein [Paenisporosarcina antarctica]|uniref:DUF1189 domain-containing protein n=1 Tax=Paenisporosarcina antarctica TaxID=417367 RepID=A0A4P6ZZB7_9BACL|nr:DUF1189 family protein [Paenisporosarcina antarctica]QBP40896.1 DUF1189 domain-containing protein [Paenisporosarcina antarctica]